MKKVDKIYKSKKRVGYLTKGDIETLELGFCPFCKSLTDFRGEFLPCCGEDIDALRSRKKTTTVTFKARVIKIEEFDQVKFRAFIDECFKKERAEWKS